MVKYYIHLKDWDVRIYKGMWGNVKAISERLHRETGLRLSEERSGLLGEVIQIIQEGEVYFDPFCIKFYDCTASLSGPDDFILLQDSEEFKRDPALFFCFSPFPCDFLQQEHPQDQLLKLISQKIGAVLDFADPENNKTLLHYCAERNFAAAVKELIFKQRSLLNAEDNRGYTALHSAYELQHFEVAIALLNEGANHAKKTNEGFLPIALLPCATGLSLMQVQSIQAFFRLVPSVSSGSVTFYFKNDEASGTRVLENLKIDYESIQKKILMKSLARKYPQAFENLHFPLKLKEGLAIRHIHSISSISRTLLAQYKSRNLDELLREKECVFDYEWIQLIARECQAKVTDLNNIFIACALASTVYTSLIPGINEALDAWTEGVAFETTYILIPAAARSFIVFHPTLKGFLNVSKKDFECKSLERLKALYNLIHRDDPRFALNKQEAIAAASSSQEATSRATVYTDVLDIARKKRKLGEDECCEARV